MDDITQAASVVGELAAQIERLHGAEVKLVADPGDEKVNALFAILPKGKHVESLAPVLDAFRTRPVRRTGKAKARDIASFVAHVNRFKDEDSVIFAVPDKARPRLLAVYDYNEGGPAAAADPRFGQHRIEYECALSEEWLAWTRAAGTQMAQGDFAAFIEDRIQDVVLVDGPHITEMAETLQARIGGPTSLMKLSRGLAVSVNNTVHNAVTLATGEVKIVFQEQHADESGAPITTPNLFFLGIPVFYGGEPYQVPVRLRYRLAGGHLVWSFLLHRADKVFDDAFKGLVDKAKLECDLPTFAGEPEA